MSAMAGRDERPRAKRVVAVVLGLVSLPVVPSVVEAVAYSERSGSNGVIVSSELEREYLLHVPASWDPARPTPLVISLHGGALGGAAQQELSQWNDLAERQGFIVVYPSGIERGPRAWEADRGPGLMRDVRFIADLIDTLSVAYNVDPGRICANGLSNGGGMAYVLSCPLSHRIAAVGVVAPALVLPWSWCVDDRPVPMIAFHGTADRMTPYRGGGPKWLTPRPFPDMPTWVAGWARRNGCSSAPDASTVARDLTRRVYADCADEAAVVLYTIHGGGHTWPGGGPQPEWFVGHTSDGIDATEAMWTFFREHPLIGWDDSARRRETAP